MIRTTTLCLALLSLGACASSTPTPPPLPDAPLSPTHAACRSEAQNDPAVISLGQQANPLNFGNQNRLAHETRVAELRAYRECLRRNGIIAPGGVEAVRR
ncbi:phosphoribosylamine--glycine ligase [Pseudoroseomonas deserti]|uniref:Phosphoribosylamine--glycine ligase n=1 Tax=Teichococcus deserti TaxID=1817963 RepID=A0A1V2H1C7_9PROT|nr:phosphoribosylamine--glycine ligase [Pseudoroseomonas deserti]ONG51490.1 phosphoribosylamine--glycine ligase [Pseudoroseomonas deserti]